MCVSRHIHNLQPRCGGVVFFWLALLLLNASNAKPVVPAADEVLLQLKPAEQAAAAAIRTVTTGLQQPAEAVQLASRFIELGRTQYDERYFGYAWATLAAWHNDRNAPSAIAVLRADIAQHQHRFIDALGILDQVVVRDPAHARARLMRATLLMTLGRAQQANADCRQLFALRQTLVATICAAQVSSLTGKLAESYRLLEQLLSRPGNSVEYAWLAATAAEMAERSGDRTTAEQWLRLALDADPADLVSRLQLCDLLLLRGQGHAALELLHEAPNSEPVLLRRALASQVLGVPVARNAELRAWQAATAQSEQLGVRLHLRELARGQLELLQAPRLALKTALENWNVQREPIDARLLLAAGRAAGDQQTVALVQEWQRTTGLEDVGLTP
jgi:tetratricopeptide (TPR) repeat protein